MHVVVLVLIEILIVIGLSRLVGLAFRRINQPLVIGEIVAGIMLGPSLFGMVAPGLAVTLFPPETVPFLNVLSQIGLIFFMFLIGLELNPKYLSGNLEVAILTSNVSIIVPFSLASLLALILYPLVSNASVPFTAFALFLGAAMSITAFPVLARIITENNLQGTRLGTLALTCAAVDDVTAWCILAIAMPLATTSWYRSSAKWQHRPKSCTYHHRKLGLYWLYVYRRTLVFKASCDLLHPYWSLKSIDDGIDLQWCCWLRTDYRMDRHPLNFWCVFARCSDAQKRRISSGTRSQNRRLRFNIFTTSIFCLQRAKNADWFTQPSGVVGTVFINIGSCDALGNHFVVSQVNILVLMLLPVLAV